MAPRVQLTRDDYTEILAFILKLRYLWGAGIGDFRESGVKRDIGKYIHDHMAGKLAERAFVKFAEQEFAAKLTMDLTQFHASGDYSKPDIVGVWEAESERDVRVKIEVKDTKPTSRWILIPQRLASTIACDFFVIVCVDVALDQLLRYFKDALPFQQDHELMSKIPDFGAIDAEIRGVIPRSDITHMLAFDKGQSLPETEIFNEAKRLPPLYTPLPNDKLEVEFEPPLGTQVFSIAGRCNVIKGGPTGKTQKSYVLAHEQVVLKNAVLGEYRLDKGKYRVEIGAGLSPLREANFGVPLRAIRDRSIEEWRTFVEAI
jgi:hypothetical protein